MPTHYKQIEGWFDFEEIYSMAVSRYSTARFLELGTWLGRSTCYMTELIVEQKKNIKFYAVDNFTGASDAINQLEDAKKVGGSIYMRFLENMTKFGILDYVTPLMGDSIEIAKLFPNEVFDFIFIDANHSFDFVKKDLEAWLPKLRSNGMIGGHDYWMEAVHKAVHACIKDNVKQVGNSWISIRNP